MAYGSDEIPNRISAKMVDLGKVQKICMVAGMATLIEVPEEIEGIRLGNAGTLTYFKPENPKNEVTLVLKGSKVLPTNLILRTKKRKYVFDIVPSKRTHQDTIEIIGDYGGPSIGSDKAVLLDSSDT